MRKGENIFKRKDGRWEGRYIKSREPSGKGRYGYCYGRSYREVKEKVAQCRAALAAGEAPPQPDRADRPGGHHQGVNTAPPCSHKDPQNRKNGEVQTKMNAKTTKRALFSSVLAIVLCLAMLIGTTFAWFTDTASTAVNKIQAGNLDVELEYSTNFSDWEKVTDTTRVFEESTLWEPGRTEVVYLRVKNAGTLALKYTLGLYTLYNSTGKNVLGNKYSLSDYVKLGAMEVDTAYTDRAAAISAVQDSAKTLNSVGDTGLIGAKLGTTETKTYAMVLYMPTEVGNEANPKNADPYWAAKVSFGIGVSATQAVSESDSYGNTYDEKAPAALAAESASCGKHEITENMQANGRYGAVQAEKTAQFTINADVYAVYTKDTSGTTGGAMAVCADGDSKVIINGGDFRQVGVPADDPVCDLIYALGNATIEINGGTFKAVTPERTLNCQDGSAAQITVKGGSFYKYDPSHPTLGANEVVVAVGYHVEQSGDWYTAAATTIRSASYTVSVTVRQGEDDPVPVIASENGEFPIDLTTGETYTIKLTPTGNATTGYCLVKYNETTYYTDQLTTGSLSFTVTAADETTLTITPTWGEYTGSEFKPLAELSLPTNDPVETDQPENETDTVESADEPKDEEQEQTPEENSDTKSPETPTEPAPDPATGNTPAEGDSAQEPTPTTPDAPAPDAPNTPTPDAPAAPNVPSAPAAAPESEN